MPDYVLSIDAGTTGITSLLVDHSGQIVSRAYREFPSYFPAPGWVEQDPLQIWDATVATAAAALGNVRANQLAAIGITDQRETTVVWERETLRPVHNAIVWQCRRSADICDELRLQGFEEEVRARTGLVLDAYFSGTKLTWLARNIEGFTKRCLAGEIAFGTIDSWIMAKLSDGNIHATDYSNASRTMLFNIHDRVWDPFLLEKLEVPSQVLPEVLPSSGRFGVTSVNGFLGTEVPISGVAGDQQSALFGQACFTTGMSKNTYGTGSFVLTNTGEAAPISNHGLLTSIAWSIDGRVDYALEGAIFITGAAVQWLRDGLGVVAHAQDTGPLAESVTSNEGVYFVPALVGLGAPWWDQHARGTITGITRGTTKAHLARAALEAMCYQTKDVIDAMAADSGVAMKELRVDGGASLNDFVCQFQSDVLQIPVARPKIAETTAMGAAYLAGLAEGFWESMQDVAERWQLDNLFEPKMSAENASELYEGWTKALERTFSR